MAIYGETFFEQNKAFTQNAAAVVAPLILQWIAPTSAVDLGCAVGEWLAEFRKQGIQRVLGVDGEYVDKQWLQIPADSFRGHDLSTPFACDERFDFAMCLEVGEHLPAESADALVASLTTMSPVVMFSAAVPEQGGVAHINEQWPSYWMNKFNQQGYVAFDCIRPRLWNRNELPWWYAQNTLLYVREDQLDRYPLLADESRAGAVFPVDLVHPRMYLGARYYSSPQTMRVKDAISLAKNVVVNAGRRRIHKIMPKTAAKP